jgi:hypothetical protein
VLRTKRPLYVRSAMDVGDACRTQHRVPAGALVAADLRVSSHRDYGVQGPFVRLTGAYLPRPDTCTLHAGKVAVTAPVDSCGTTRAPAPLLRARGFV